MRVLFLSSWYPCPPDNGSRIRVFNLIKQLSRWHEITLLSFARSPVPEERVEEMEAYCRSVQVVPYRAFNPNRLKALLGFLSIRPRSVIDTYSREMQALVEKVCADESFDVVVASEMDAAQYALLVDRAARVFEDIELAVIREQSMRLRSPVSRVRSRLTWWKLSRFLPGLLRYIDGCTVVSEQERDLLAAVVPGYDLVAVVPNGVDSEAYSGDFGVPEPDSLIYSGALTYGANFDAMDFFLRDVFPLLKAQRPNASLRITGRYDGVPVERLPLGNGVELTGYLDDIRPAVAQSRVCVVPLRVGGGTRLKILEAMALGTPVVSTSKGAEGLEARAGEDLLVADDPGEFTRMVVRLLSDDALYHRVRDNGRRLVRRLYDWGTIGARLNVFLEDVSARYRVRPRRSGVIKSRPTQERAG